MQMVITLRNGVQLRMEVESFSTGSSPIGGDLRRLEWKGRTGSTDINWLDMREVVAVHGEDVSGEVAEPASGA